MFQSGASFVPPPLASNQPASFSYQAGPFGQPGEHHQQHDSQPTLTSYPPPPPDGTFPPQPQPAFPVFQQDSQHSPMPMLDSSTQMLFLPHPLDVPHHELHYAFRYHDDQESDAIGPPAANQASEQEPQSLYPKRKAVTRQISAMEWYLLNPQGPPNFPGTINNIGGVEAGSDYPGNGVSDTSQLSSHDLVLETFLRNFQTKIADGTVRGKLLNILNHVHHLRSENVELNRRNLELGQRNREFARQLNVRDQETKAMLNSWDEAWRAESERLKEEIRVLKVERERCARGEQQEVEEAMENFVSADEGDSA